MRHFDEAFDPFRNLFAFKLRDSVFRNNSINIVSRDTDFSAWLPTDNYLAVDSVFRDRRH